MKAVKISKNKWNYLKNDGSYLLDTHVFNCCDFCEGFGIIRYDDETENFVNSDGKKLLKTDVDYCYNFKDGFANVEINYVWYRINSECNFYSYPDKVSFKDMYSLYYNMRSLLIEIISKYTYYDVEEYFNI